jgi:hypothetical protein
MNMRIRINVSTVIVMSLCVSAVRMANAMDKEKKVTYRRAQQEDLGQIVDLYSTMDLEGKSNVVEYPKQIIKDVFTKSVDKKHMFVALEGDKLISCLKVARLQDKDLDEELVGELNIGNTKQFQELRQLNFNNDGSYTTKSSRKNIDHESFVKNVLKPSIFENKNSLNLYYGRAYTSPTYRGKGICTKLLSTAFGDVIRDETVKGCTVFSLGFGLVDANKGHTYMLRPFIKRVREILGTKKSIGDVQQSVYTAYRPDLSFDTTTNEVKVSFPEKNKGCGNLVVAQLVDKKEGMNL